MPTCTHTGRFIPVPLCSGHSEKTIALKMADQGRSDFCVVLTKSLCSFDFNVLLISFC